MNPKARLMEYRAERNTALPSKGTTPPYNNRIEPTARGRHALCGFSMGSILRAKVAPVPSGPFSTRRALRPCSRLIRALYGRGRH